MRSKITDKTRVKIIWSQITNLKKDYDILFTDDLIKLLEKEGLKYTSSRWSITNGQRFYFKVVDKQKYMLAKIKYGL